MGRSGCRAHCHLGARWTSRRLRRCRQRRRRTGSRCTRSPPDSAGARCGAATSGTRPQRQPRHPQRLRPGEGAQRAQPGTAEWACWPEITSKMAAPAVRARPPNPTMSHHREGTGARLPWLSSVELAWGVGRRPTCMRASDVGSASEGSHRSVMRRDRPEPAGHAARAGAMDPADGRADRDTHHPCRLGVAEPVAVDQLDSLAGGVGQGCERRLRQRRPRWCRPPTPRRSGSRRRDPAAWHDRSREVSHR